MTTARGVSGAAPAGSWLPTTAEAWLPGDPVPEPEPTDGTTPAWAAPAATGWGGGGVSRFGTPAPAYGAPAAPVVLGVPPAGVVGPAAGWTPGAPEGGWQPSGAPAHWGWRVLASLLDQLIVATPYLAGAVYAQTTMSTTADMDGRPVLLPTAEGMNVFGAGALVMLVLWFVNRVVLQGRGGQSWGKRIVGLRTVGEDTQRPLGMWWAFVRDVANVVNALPLYLGYLWPLWDARRQTFSDKLAHALVLRDVR
ncbi:RDD family protein [Cellulomonas dongxiuzhuiae]|uniref:RDD family protein n=1 Tax=Cellulomonas dongxiuzhuiae TaxID=2819979 RepID=A0ABX8GQF7_9CELL|nr:RDD family protein [Cellulomonas dongxiuzhuiae]QWC18037.1 RDD family protein [Cellulomonas dongxiuzhuiae]